METKNRQGYRTRGDSPHRGRGAWVESVVAGSLLVALFVIAACSGGVQVDPRSTAVVSVRSGDTIWDLARRNPVQGGDTASSVEAILVLNGLHQGSLTPGQRLLVPGSREQGSVAMR